MSQPFPELLRGRPAAERDLWARWVLGSHSDQFLPEMTEAVAQLDKQDPIACGRPVINPGAQAKDVVVLACERGKHCFVLDQPLNCEVVLFDWTGEGVDPDHNPHHFTVMSVATECKGHLMEEAWKRLPVLQSGHFMGFVDDDVLLRSSDINTLLAMVRIYNLSAAQPAVTFTSSLCQEYGWLRQRASSSLHRVPIIEIMAPFIRSDLLQLAMPFLRGVRSGYGLDRFALPLCAAHLGAWRFAAIDSTPLSHVRQFGSLEKRFSNGLQSKEEELLIRHRLMQSMGFPVDQALNQRLEGAIAV
ncbi:hypothetical protein [Synechococcus sp. NOUM97013]|uniref:hypothetical protein n=1 Tax=Synechococcus sp. NOUM97013 TaxID=1442555 RepID=UPI00164915C9|nr:hypothetical protein [Synechococcus sp. NOUM97013]QNI74325.1 hypothetical protein SynNOUM97013_02273 [Synechococcus sp. NOUM97013]